MEGNFVQGDTGIGRRKTMLRKPSTITRDTLNMTDGTENSEEEMEQFNKIHGFVSKGCPAKADQK